MHRFDFMIGPVTSNVHFFLSKINLCENCAFGLFYLLCFTKKPHLHAQKLKTNLLQIYLHFQRRFISLTKEEYERQKTCNCVIFR